MAASTLKTWSCQYWSHEKRFTPSLRGLEVTAVSGRDQGALQDSIALAKSCLRNVWAYLGVLILFIPLGVSHLQPYRLGLTFTLLFIGLFVGSLSVIRKLRNEVALLSIRSYDIALGNEVRRILSKFSAKERVVLRALVLTEPWNRWKHLPNVYVPLYEQFEIIYKALQERLLIHVDSEGEFVQFVPKYLEPAKDLLFSPDFRPISLSDPYVGIPIRGAKRNLPKQSHENDNDLRD